MQPIIGALLGVAREGAEAPAGSAIDYLPLFAQDEAGWRQPVPPRQPRASRPAAGTRTACHARRSGRAHRRADRADRRGRGRGHPAVRRGPGTMRRAATADALRSAVPRPALYRTRAARRSRCEDAAEEALIDLAYARDFPLVATNPANFRRAAAFTRRMTRCCASPIRPISTPRIGRVPARRPWSSPRR